MRDLHVYGLVEKGTHYDPRCRITSYFYDGQNERTHVSNQVIDGKFHNRLESSTNPALKRIFRQGKKCRRPSGMGKRLCASAIYRREEYTRGIALQKTARVQHEHRLALLPISSSSKQFL